jgi:macrolide transport system ATP-binding/permease protein
MIELIRRIRFFLSSSRRAADLAEEMEFHRDMLAADGARPAAMGNTTLAHEDARAVWIRPWLESLWQDAVYGLRAMRREPAFTATALLALGSAIGVNTSLFTIFNAFALQTWTVRDPGHVATIHRFTRHGVADFGIAEYRYLAQNSHALSGVVAMRNGEEVHLDNRPLQLTYVSGDYFRVLGVDLERGRGFVAEEDHPSEPQAVAVLSHDAWQNRLGGDPQVVGRTIRLDGVPFTVVGVTPEDFHGTNPLRNEVWAPLPARLLLRSNDPGVKAWLTQPEICCTPVAGRLAPGSTRARAEAELSILLDRFRAENHLAPDGQRIVLTGTSWMDSPGKKRQVVPTMILLFLAVTLVLLLACANVGNLLVARAAARRREIAVRLSLGGSRLRLIRQLLVESLLLALTAAAIALPVTFVAPQGIIHRLAGEAWYRVTPDVHVLVYTIAIAVSSCVIFGLAPALHGTSGGIASALKTDVPLGGARLPLRSILLGVQVAISVMLLAGAGALVRGLQHAQRIDPGYDVLNVTVLSIDLPASQYAGPRMQGLTAELQAQLERSRELPAAGLAQSAPLANATYMTSFQVLEPVKSPETHIWVSSVSPGYFDALRIRLVEGRNFTAEDATGGIVINQTAARRWWPETSPIGKSVLANTRLRKVIGIVADTCTHDLSACDEAMLYLPLTGTLGPPVVLVHDRTPATTERIAAIVKGIEPRAHVRAEPLSANFDRQMQPNVIGAALAGSLGLLALGIAAIGMSGVFAYVVGRRTREIGVRMALGAGPGPIVRLVLGSAVRPLTCGLSAGIVLAAGVSKLLAGILPGVGPADPLAYAGVILLLGAAVALASAIPARRATRINPVTALRWE